MEAHQDAAGPVRLWDCVLAALLRRRLAMRTSTHLLAFTFVAATAAAAQTPTAAGDVNKAKPQESAAVIPAEVKPDFTQEGAGSLGSIFNSGNVQGASGRLGGFYGARYLQHGLRFDVGMGLAALAIDGDGDPANGFTKIDQDGNAVEASAFDNINTSGFAKLRYDYFLGDFGSIYAAGLLFHDSAVNLLLRSRADVGYRHFFFNVPKHQLSAEAGVVYTIDNGIFNVEGADTNNDGKVFVWGDDTQFEASGGVVGVRLAATYTNALLENITFIQNVEIIPNVSFGPDIPVFGDVAAPFEQVRSPDGQGDNRLGLGEATIFNAVSSLVISLSENLNVGFNLNLIYDNGAVARRNAYTNYDAALSATLGYKFF